MYEGNLEIIFLNLLITAVLYGAFPLLVANNRKKEITSKKYFWQCVAFNFFVWICAFIFEELAYGSGSKGGAYMLWTFVFEAIGISKLKKRGLIIEKKGKKEKRESVPVVSKNTRQEEVSCYSVQPKKAERQNVVQSKEYKDDFIKELMEETQYTEEICEDIYNIYQTFNIYGKETGIKRLRMMEDDSLKAKDIDTLKSLATMYSNICGMMVGAGHLTEEEAEEIVINYSARYFLYLRKLQMGKS